MQNDDDQALVRHVKLDSKSPRPRLASLAPVEVQATGDDRPQANVDCGPTSANRCPDRATRVNRPLLADLHACALNRDPPGRVHRRRSLHLALLTAMALVPQPVLAMTWCPGTDSAPARRLEIQTSAAGAAPYVQLAPDVAAGAWLVDYGATESSANRLAALPQDDLRWVSPDKKHLRLGGFDFTTPPQDRIVANMPRAISEDHVGLQQGVIGTDILGQHSVEFHYENPADQHLLVSPPGCQLAGRGFFLIRQAGFFGSQPAHYAKQQVNVPVVFTAFEKADGKLAAKTVYTQLDTGMADTVWPRTVYVNDALWKEIRSEDAVRAGEIAVKQCAGSANLEAWILPETRLQITDETGYWMTKYPAFYVVPLQQLPADSPCGGIATKTTPAAQIGASFLRSFGTVVVDPGAYPDGGAVWIKMPTPPSPEIVARP